LSDIKKIFKSYFQNIPQQNLGNLLSVYTDPRVTRAVWIVAPAYFLAFGVFADAGFGGRMRAVGEDGE
jgi:hypothetical protein